MLDHKKGELIVDGGVSFTPQSDQPVSGIWRLDALEESDGAAGFNREPFIHHQRMLSRYSAMQTEINQERALQTHVSFRSTYNLYYEAVHTTNNVATFAKDSDAYNLTPKYYGELLQLALVTWSPSYLASFSLSIGLIILDCPQR